MMKHKRVNIKILISLLVALFPLALGTVDDRDGECDDRDDAGHSGIYFEQFNYFINFSSNEISEECQNSVERLMRLAKTFDMTALKILDASAKINSGLLNGNVNQYGDFDECLEAKSEELQGKYCLADFQLHAHKSLQHIKDLLLSYEPYKNKFNDVVHLTPKTSNILWGVCMPSSCTHRDLEVAIKNAINTHFGRYFESIELVVKENNCQVALDEPSRMSLETKLTIAFFTLILLLSLASTIYDASTSENKHRKDLLLAFSVKKNIREIFSTETNDKEITALHGIRFINTMLIMICHKAMEIHYQPIANRTTLKKTYEGTLAVPLRASYLSTEVFLMISGLLTTYSLVGRFNRGQKVSIFREIVARYLRYTPPVVALILFYTFILPHLGNGPIWPILVGSQTEMCKRYCWRNFLMIHNWFSFENMCMFNLHHIGTDFTLFVSSIVLIVKLHKYPRFNIAVFLLIIVTSTIARFYIVYTRELALYIRYGVDLGTLVRTGNEMYGVPPYRFACYIFGIIMGYALRNHKPTALTPAFTWLGWILATFGLFFAAFISIMNNERSDPLLMALFAAIAPLTLCLAFAWIIFVSHCGEKSVVSRFFGWKYFKITTSLSYGLYLVQFSVFNFNASTARTSIVYSYYNDMFDLNEFLAIMVAALIMTLFIELPFENIRKKLFDTKVASRNKHELNASEPKKIE